MTSAETFTVKIYMSGPIEVAKQALREYCMRLHRDDNTDGLCATIESTTFIYTGGEEQGFVIGLLNYPRFPTTPELLLAKARTLVEWLLDVTCQWSALIVTPETTEWFNRRPL